MRELGNVKMGRGDVVGMQGLPCVAALQVVKFNCLA